MAALNDITKLDNYEDEDILDVVQKIEKSFGLKLEKEALYNVQTFGNLCDIFTTCLHGENSADCTTQQAFYKVRHAIARIQLIDAKSINLDAKLQDIFPRNNRRIKIQKLKRELNIPFKVLDIKAGLGWSIAIGVAASLLTLFFKWQFAVTGLLLFTATGWIAYKFYAKEFEVATVRQLTEKLARENYVNDRRKKGTINKQEISKVIIEIFSNDLGIAKTYLTRNEKFSWAT